MPYIYVNQNLKKSPAFDKLIKNVEYKNDICIEKKINRKLIFGTHIIQNDSCLSTFKEKIQLQQKNGVISITGATNFSFNFDKGEYNFCDAFANYFRNFDKEFMVADNCRVIMEHIYNNWSNEIIKEHLIVFVSDYSMLAISFDLSEKKQNFLQKMFSKPDYMLDITIAYYKFVY